MLYIQISTIPFVTIIQEGLQTNPNEADSIQNISLYYILTIRLLNCTAY